MVSRWEAVLTGELGIVKLDFKLLTARNALSP